MAHFLLATSLCAGYVLFGKFVLRLKADKLKNLSDEYLEKLFNPRMSQEQKVGFTLLVMFILILVAPLFLPAGIIKAVLANIELVGAAVLAIIFVCFRDGLAREKKYPFGKMVYQGINWEIIILFASTFPVSAAMESRETGIVDTVVGALMPIFCKISPAVYLLFCFLLFVAITQVAHNLILGIVFTAVLATIGISMGINPYLFQIFFAWGLQLAFMTPGASANSAMIFGNSEWISSKDSYKYTAAAVFCGVVIAIGLLPILIAIF